MLFRFIPLDQRLLFDASVAAIVAHAHHDALSQSAGDTAAPAPLAISDTSNTSHESIPVSHQKAIPSPNATATNSGGESHSDPHSHTHQPVNVLVVASDIPNLQQFIAAANKDTVVVTYNEQTATLADISNSISAALNGRTASSIGFASHGEAGQFVLTQNVTVDANTMASNVALQQFWQEIGNMVQTGGQVDLLACFVAQGNTTELTQVDTLLNANQDGHSNITLAASTGLVGNPAGGGSWYLSYGGVNVTNLYFNPTALSQWTGELTGVSISGTVFEDPNATGTMTGAEAPPSAVTVYLYQDVNSTGIPASNDPLVQTVTTTLTSGSQVYTFNNVTPGDYFVVVNSTTVTPSEGLNAGAGTPWATETYGPAGSVLYNGSTYSFTSSSGAVFGGETPSTPDSPGGASPVGATSIADVVVSSSNITNENFGFSFSAITNTNNASQGSLAQFINNSNDLVGVQTSEFNIGTVGSAHTITLSSALSNVTDSVILDGFTQGGTGYSGVPLISIVGNAVSGSDGIDITGGAPTSTVQGLAISGFAGAEIHAVSNTDTISDNYIGFELNGTTANTRSAEGILASGTGDTISSNLVWSSGSADIYVTGASVTISSNLMGTNDTGLTAAGAISNVGIYISGCTGTIVIQGNTIDDFGAGISAFSLGAASTLTITSNNIGVGSDGATSIHDIIGVLVQGSNSVTIGGSNIIANNTSNGIEEGGTNTSISIRENSIYNNGTQGITGAASPGLTFSSATFSAGQINVNGIIHAGLDNTPYNIDFYASSVAGPGLGQGAVYLGTELETSSATGTINFSDSIATSTSFRYISATTTNVYNAFSHPNPANTSLFSSAVYAPSAPVVNNQSFSTPVNDGTGAVVGTEIATDTNPGAVLSYSMLGSSAFSINSSTGKITVASALNEANSPYTLTVTVKDTTFNLTSTATTTITATSQPITAPNQAFQTPGNDSVGTVIGSVTDTDPNGGTLTYSITGGNTGSVFSISSGGSISVANTLSLANNPYSLTVKATDNFGVTASSTVTITLDPLITGKVFLDLYAAGTDPNSTFASPTPVTVYLYKDNGDGIPDPGDTLVATTTTNSGGQYTFVEPAGTYWVAVNSQTFSVDLNLVSGGTEPVSVESYGPAGSVLYNGTTYTFTASGGPVFGGETPSIPDNPGGSSPVGATSIAEAILTPTANITSEDFGFSPDEISNTNNSGQGSLRQFILNANALASEQTSEFRIGTAGSQQIITLTTALPTITTTIMMDGWTQDGAGTTYTGVPLISIVGDNLTGSVDGIDLGSGYPGSVIEGFAISGFTNAEIESDSYGITINNNYIGFGLNGITTDSRSLSGILFTPNTANDQTVTYNLIWSANTAINMSATSQDAVIENNYIGTTLTGLTAAGPMGTNTIGIDVGPCEDVYIENNVIDDFATGILANNVFAGIGATITSNDIGVGFGGTVSIPDGIGIYLNSTDEFNIGTTSTYGTVQAGNIIANNTVDGIDEVGINHAVIRYNSMYNNATQGILGSSGEVNITSALAVTGGIEVSGTLVGLTRNGVYDVDFYASPVAGPGLGQGKLYIGTDVFNASSSGTNTFSYMITTSTTFKYISGTVTSTGNQIDNNTSDYSNAEYAGVLPVVTPESFTIPVNTAVSTVVGTLPVTDGNPSPTLSYAITAGDTGNAFAINGATGVIKVNNPLNLTNSPYSLTITVTDQYGEQGSAIATITTTYSPLTAPNDSFNIPANAAIGAVVGTVTDTDPNSGTLTYSITGGDTGNAFAINSSTGQITVSSGLSLADSSYSLSVQATDQYGVSATSTAAITVTPVPLTAPNDSFNVPVNATVGTVVGTVADTDPDGGTLSYSITGGDTGNAFAINSSTGQITVNSGLSVADSNYSLSVKATDQYGITATSTATITVTSSPLTAPNDSFNIPANAAIGAVVGTVTDTDPNGGTLTYSVTGGNTGNAFSINSSTGQITVNSGLSLADSSYSLSVQATDQYGVSATSTAAITVTPVPLTAPNDSFNVPVNAVVGTVVGTVTDTDQNGGTLSYSITGGDTGNAFVINSSTGQITVNSGLSVADSNYSLSVKATDQYGVTATSTAAITVTSSPLTAPNDSFNIPANAAIGTVVGTVADTDPNGGTLTYSITGGDTGNVFAINSATGQITVSSGLSLADSSYSLSVQATDQYGVSATSTAAITVTPVPLTAPNDSFSVPVNAIVGTVVGTVADTDQNGGTLSYSITGGDTGNAFAINSSTGQITVNSGLSVADSNYSLSVKATDQYGVTATSTAAITVTSSPLTAPNDSFNIPANAAIGTVVGTVADTDPNSGTLTYSITGGDTGNAFAINSSTGQITVSSGLSLADSSYSLSVQATDQYGVSATSTAAITVTPVPLTAPNDSFNVPVNAAIGAVVGTVADTDSNGGTLSYSITGGDTGNAFVINSSTGQITVNAGLTEADTNYSLSVKAIDQYGVTATSTAAITVTSSPLTAPNDSFTIPANATVGTAVGTVTDTDPNGGTLTYSITGGDIGNAFVINSSTGQIKVNSGLSLADSNYSLSVQATDQYGVSATSTAGITVTPVPLTAPNDSFTVPVNATVGTVVGTVTDTDQNGGTLTYSITGGDTGNAFVINNSTGQITVNSGLTDADTNYSLSVKATDQYGVTATSTAAITVTFSPLTAPNDSFTIPANATVGTAVGTVTDTDPNGGTLTYSIASGDTGNAFVINSSTGKITVNSGLSLADASYSLSVQATDQYGVTATSMAGITVTPVPLTAPNDSFTVPVNATVGAVVGTVSDTDQNGGTLTYSITGGDPGNAFVINSSTGQITVNSGLTEADTNYSLSVKAIDQYGVTATSTASITVTSSPLTAPNDSFTIPANATVGTAVGTVTDTDPNGGTLTYSITSGDTGNAFVINSSTGQITVNGGLSLADTNYSLSVHAIDQYGVSATSTAGITVIPVPLTAPNDSFTVPVNATVGTVVGTVSDTDQNGGTLSYSITGGDTGNAFVINSSTGQITVNSGLSVADSNYSLSVKATDQYGVTATSTAAITVTSSPLTAPNDSFNIPANAAIGTVVGTVADSDPNGGTLIYSITGGDTGNAFAINSSTGKITVNSGLSLADSNYSLSVQATDQYAVSATSTAAITVTPVPLTAPNDSFNVPVNATVGTVVGTVADTDQNGGTLTYSITGGDTGNAFTINSSTGQITVNSGLSVADSNYSLSVKATDQYGVTATSTAAITVTSSPLTAPNDSFNIPANAAIGAVVGTVADTDPNGGTLTYSITGGDTGNAFAINSSTGKITVNSGLSLADSNYSLSVQATDQYGVSATSTAAITVTPVPLTAPNDSFTVPVNATVGTVVGTIADTDQNGGTLSYSITGGDTGNAFAINSSTGQITVNSGLSVADSNYSLSVKATDQYGVTATSTAAITVTSSPLTAPNDSFNIPANAAIGTVVGTVADTDPNGGTLTYSITGGNTGNAFAINNSTGQITVSSGLSLADSSYSLSVQAIDQYGASATSTAAITVTPVPLTAPNDSFNVPVNTARGVVIGTVVDTDQNGGTLSYSIVGGDIGDAFGINSSNGRIAVNNGLSVADSHYSLSVKATDQYGVTATSTVTITVTSSPLTAPNDSFNIPANAAIGTVVGTVADTDPNGGTLTYSITGGDTGNAFSINSSTGQITVNSGLSLADSNYSLSVQATDQYGVSATSTAAITVTPVPLTAPNDSFTVPVNATVGTVVGTVADTDSNGGTLSYSITGGDTGNAFAINSSTGQITVNSGLSVTDSNYSLSVKAIDQYGVTATSTAAITVTSSPLTAPNDSFNIPANAAIGAVVGTVADTDPNSGTLSYSITGGDTGNAFAINSSTGQITVSSGLSLADSNYSLSVQATDQYGVSATSTAAITVTPVPLTAPNDSFNVPVNAAIGAVVGTVADTDSNGGTLSYSITGGDTGNAFTINSSTGQITVNSGLSVADSNYNLSVKATDQYGVTATSTAAITVTSSPLTAPNDSFNIPANAAIGTVVGTVADTDPNGGTLTYSITSGDTGNAFSINSSTGQITVNNGLSLADSNYSLSVQATDQYGVSATSTAAITVTPVPLTAPNDSFTVPVNATVGTVVGTVTDTDQNGGTLSYSITGGDPGNAFAINSSTGQITVNSGLSVSDTNYSLSVQATDQYGVTATSTTAVTVTSSPLIASNDSFNIPVNAATGTAVGTVADTDPNSGTLTYSITGGDTGSAFVINSSTGQIQVNSALSLANSNYTLSVQATDQYGVTATSTAAITVTDVAPVANNDSYTVETNNVLTVTVANGVLVNDSNSGDGETLTAVLISQASDGTVSLNSNGSFTYTPTTGNFTGTDTFTYNAENQNGLFSTTPATVTITVINLPILANNDSYATETNNALTISAASGVLVNDSNNGNGETLTAVPETLTTAQGGSVILSSDGSFLYTPSHNYRGTDTFTYQDMDASSQLSNFAIVSIVVSDQAPVAVNDTYGTESNNSITVAPGAGVLSNDSNSGDFETLASALVTQAMHGVVTLNIDGSFTYTPNHDFQGTDTFTYQAKNENSLLSNTATVSIVVTDQNPVAANDSYATETNNPITVAAGTGVLFNDSSSGDSEILTSVLVAQATHGVVTLNTDGSFTYTPNHDFQGTDTFTYQAKNENGLLSNTATVSIVVTDQSPVATNDSYATETNNPITVAAGTGVLFNDSSSGDSEALTSVLVAQATHGVITLNTDGSFTYTPNHDFQGTDTFTYQAKNENGLLSNTATVSILVTDQAPAGAASQSYSTETNNTLSLASPGVLANSSNSGDFENLTAVPETVTTTGGGIVTINSDGSTIYTPAHDFQGTDTFTYQVMNENGLLSDTATVSIVVTDQNPIANNDSYATETNSPITVAVGTGVLSNDSSSGDSETLTSVLVAQAMHGLVTLNMDGSFTYTPNHDFKGTDTFTYQAKNENGLLSNTATVSIVVTDENPVATNDSYATETNNPITVAAGTGVLFNDSNSGDSETLTSVLVAQATHGVVALSMDGSFTYTPNHDFQGTDTFTYQAKNENGLLSNTATVSIVVTDQAPAGSASQSYSTETNNTLSLASPGLLTNSSNSGDFENLTAVPETVTTTGGGTVTVNSDGSTIYTPAHDFQGTDTFTYQVKNENGLLSAPATVSIVVTDQNPVAANDSYATETNNPITVVVGTGVLSNDSSSGDGETLTSVLVAQATHGVVTLNTDGSFTYTPNHDFQGTDTFTYQAKNENGLLSNTATVSIVLTDQNPVAANDSYATETNNPITVAAGAGVLANDNSSGDNETLTSVLVAQATHGAVTLNADGSFTYTPNHDFQGTDTFTYQAKNENGLLSNIATVNIVMTDQAPAGAASQSYSTETNNTLSLASPGILANSSNSGDFENLTVIPETVTTTGGGTVTVNSDGSTTYTPAHNFQGTDTFTYQVMNENGLFSDTATVSIVVTDRNPVANNDSYATETNNPITVAAGTGVLFNDSSSGDNETLASVLVAQATHGVVTLNTDGSFTYTPNHDFKGTDTFTYQAKNENGLLSNTATVSIVVTDQNPVATNDSYATETNNPITVAAGTGVLFNDSSSGDSETLTSILVAQATHGVVILNTDGSFTYTPNHDFQGTDTFTYQAKNENGLLSNTATVSIVVTDQAPAGAANQSYSTETNNILSLASPGVLTNSSNSGDFENLTAVPETVTTTGGGTVIVNSDGSTIYTPAHDFQGTDTFTYQVKNENGLLSTPATVSIVVADQNPVATNDSYATETNNPITVAAGTGVLFNDSSSGDSETLTSILVAQATYGVVTLNTDGSFTYTPNHDFQGTDTFTYQAKNENGLLSNTATVSIVVTDQTPAGAIGQSYSTETNNALSLSSPGVLTNSSNSGDGETLTAVPETVTTTDGGTATVNSDGSTTYTPAHDFQGTDTFTYQVKNENGLLSAPATVSIVVTDQNPVAANDSYATETNNPITVVAGAGVLFNDSSSGDNETLTSILVAQATHGVVTLNTDGSFTYTPNHDFQGTDTFTYQAKNENGLLSNTATVSIVVTDQNPVATNDSYATETNNPITVAAGTGVLFNDSSSGDSETLTSVLVAQATHGMVTLNADGSFTYTPNHDFQGTDTFTYQAKNENGLLSNAATVSIVVTDQNPVAANDNYVTETNNPVTVAAGAGVLANDNSSGDSETLTSVLVAQATNGVVTLNTDGSFTYTPNHDFKGTDTFTYQAKNENGLLSNTATVSIVVTDQNPVATNDSYVTETNNAITVTAGAGVLANDNSSGDNETLTSVLVVQATNGVVTLNTDGSFTYTPNHDFQGTDTFTYQAKNENGLLSNTATVSIVVTDQNPVAVNDSYATETNNSISIPAGTGVLASDNSSGDNETLSSVLVAQAMNGVVTLNTDGSFTYTPNHDFKGTDTFTYQAKNENGLLSNTATVSIVVTDQNPVANNDSYATETNNPITVAAGAGVLSNDSSSGDSETLTSVLVAQATHGVVTLNTDGSFTYIPNHDFQGTDTFTYQAKNANGLLSNTATVSIVVTDQNPVAANDSYATETNNAITVAAGAGVLSNDNSSGDSETLTSVLVAQATNGVVTLNTDGSFTYTPNHDFQGTDTFTYQVKNENGLLSNTATVSIVVTDQNPVAANDSYATETNNSISIPAGTGVLANDNSSGDNETLTSVLVAQATNGVVILNSDGSFTYTPNHDFHGTDTFTYQAKNENGLLSNTATVSIVVTDQNPVAANDSYATETNNSISIPAGIGILANDNSSGDNETLTSVLVVQAANGVVTLNTDGSFTYTPNHDFQGTDTFTYQAKNENGLLSNTATVSIVVADRNPLAVNDSYATEANNSISIPAGTGVLANDNSSGDSEALTSVLVAQATNGVVTLNADGSFTYTPNHDFQGTDTFTYQAKNENGLLSNTATVSIVVTDQAPAGAASQSYSTETNNPLSLSAPGILTNSSNSGDGETLTAVPETVTTTDGGTATVNSDGSTTYTPAPNFQGTDTFTYQVKNENGLLSAPATVSIVVTDQAPIANNDNYATETNNLLTVPVGTGVLFNDSNSGDGEALTSVLVAQATNGVVTLNTNGSFTYTPNHDFQGTDTFTYQAKNANGLLSNTATVSIVVTDQAPAGAASQSYSTETNNPLSLLAPGVLTNSSNSGDGESLTAVPETVTTTDGGTVTVNSDGSTTYTPPTNFSGTDSFTYQVKNENGLLSAPATVSIVVTDQNPVATNDNYATETNNLLTVPVGTGVPFIWASVIVLGDLLPCAE